MNTILKAALATVILFGVWASPASAELSINPHRLVIEPQDRAASVTLMNRGVAAETYRLYWVYRRMNEGLRLEAAETAEEAGVPDSAAIIRYSPRQVTLEAGESQTVRLLVRRPADLPEGEYRAHLMFEREPDLVEMGSREGEGLSISMHVAYGISMPVIVRHGNVEADIQEFEADYNRESVTLNLRRGGASSVYGNLVVTHVNGGQEFVVARIPNLAIYSEVDTASVELPLTWPDGTPATSGQLRLTLHDRESADDRLLAQDVIELN